MDPFEICEKKTYRLTAIFRKILAEGDVPHSKVTELKSALIKFILSPNYSITLAALKKIENLMISSFISSVLFFWIMALSQQQSLKTSRSGFLYTEARVCCGATRTLSIS